MQKSYEDQIKSLKHKLKAVNAMKTRHDHCKKNLKLGSRVRDKTFEIDVYVIELHDYHFKAESRDRTRSRNYMYADVDQSNGFTLYF